MTKTRYAVRTPAFTSPWRELDDMFSNRLGRILDDAWSNTTAGDWIPAVNVQETGTELTLTAELPGMSEEDVELELENNVLTIRGEKVAETTDEDEEARSHVFERRYGSFTRSFSLPRTVQSDGIEATFRNGVLTVHMPKVPEAKGRKIAVKTEG